MCSDEVLVADHLRETQSRSRIAICIIFHIYYFLIMRTKPFSSLLLYLLSYSLHASFHHHNPPHFRMDPWIASPRQYPRKLFICFIMNIIIKQLQFSSFTLCFSPTRTSFVFVSANFLTNEYNSLLILLIMAISNLENLAPWFFKSDSKDQRIPS